MYLLRFKFLLIPFFIPCIFLVYLLEESGAFIFHVCSPLLLGFGMTQIWAPKSASCYVTLDKSLNLSELFSLTGRSPKSLQLSQFPPSNTRLLLCSFYSKATLQGKDQRDVVLEPSLQN